MKNLNKTTVFQTLNNFKAFEINKAHQFNVKGGISDNDGGQEVNSVFTITSDVVDIE